MELSFTRLRVYLECPFKYKLMFADGKRIPPTPASSLGLSLHKALEAFHRGGGEELAELLDCYERSWFDGGFADEETRRLWRLKGRRILEKYFEAERGRRTELEGLEREFIYPLGRHTVRGMIDRIDRHLDGSIELIDYKTQFDAAFEAPAEKSLQLRFYALGARECFALEPSALTVHYLASGRRASAPYDPAGEEDLKRLILETADRIEAAEFAPAASFCPRCGFRLSCPHSAARGA